MHYKTIIKTETINIIEKISKGYFKLWISINKHYQTVQLRIAITGDNSITALRKYTKGIEQKNESIFI